MLIGTKRGYQAGFDKIFNGFNDLIALVSSGHYPDIEGSVQKYSTFVCNLFPLSGNYLHTFAEYRSEEMVERWASDAFAG